MSLDNVAYNEIRRIYIDDNTLNPGVLFEDEGTPYGATLAITRNVETGDLWAKRDLDITTAIPVFHGITSLGYVRMRGGSGATCVCAGYSNTRIGWRRLGGFNEDF